MTRRRKAAGSTGLKSASKSALALLQTTKPADSLPAPEEKGNKMQGGAPLYTLRQVVRRREKGGQVFELLVPALAVNAGEYVALVGESGCGKSTLLDMLGLILTPSSAEEFTLNIPNTGEKINAAALTEAGCAAVRRQYLGYVLQTGGLLPFLTVEQNMLLPCQINGETDAKPRVQALARKLGIEAQLSKKPQYLSGGQRQRAAIVRALAHQPAIVLADEPTAAVDRLQAERIRDQFKALTRELNVAVVVVTHDDRMVTGTADKIYTFKIRQIDADHVQSELYLK